VLFRDPDQERSKEGMEGQAKQELWSQLSVSNFLVSFAAILPKPGVEASSPKFKHANPDYR
jgi:hypothetical protein